MKDVNMKSRSKLSVRAATNEGAFKTPATQVTPTKRSGGGGTNTSNVAKDTLNTSASSAIQPQYNQSSPDID